MSDDAMNGVGASAEAGVGDVGVQQQVAAGGTAEASSAVQVPEAVAQPGGGQSSAGVGQQEGGQQTGASQGESQQGGQQQGSRAAADVAEAMRSAYALTEPEAAQDEGLADGAPGEAGGEAAYAVEYPEGFAADAAFTEIVTPIAKESGLDGRRFGELAAKVLHGLNEAEYANMARTDAELKRDWGADYQANMKAARAEAAFLKKEAGLTDEDLRVFACPKGMRALYAISRTHGERAAAGTQGAASVSEKSWAQEVMSNPAHPDYRAFHDPEDPRWRKVNERWNRANGLG